MPIRDPHVEGVNPSLNLLTRSPDSGLAVRLFEAEFVTRPCAFPENLMLHRDSSMQAVAIEERRLFAAACGRMQAV